nr:hypothetical protein [Rhodococcus sp. MEB064]
MTAEPPEDSSSLDDPASRARERRARLARVFGEVLPESTSDDSVGSEPHGGDSSGRSEEWLRSQRPPHYE